MKKSQKKESFLQRHSGIKGWTIFLLILIIIISLMTTNNQYSSPGFYGHLSIPGRFLIANFGKFVGGYGIAIILLTAIVRLFLMPLMIKQQKNAIRNQIGMKIFKPEIDSIRKKFKKASSKAEKHKQSQRLMNLYKKHHLGLGNIGCGTILLQIPIFGMLYAAIRYSPEISHASFCSVPLGRPSLTIAFIAFVLYMINAVIAKKNVEEDQGKQPKPKNEKEAIIQKRSKSISNLMMFGMPFWIGWIAMFVSAGLALYFCVGGLFVIGQQTYIHKITPAVKANERKKVEQAEK